MQTESEGYGLGLLQGSDSVRLLHQRRNELGVSVYQKPPGEVFGLQLLDLDGLILGDEGRGLVEAESRHFVLNC